MLILIDERDNFVIPLKDKDQAREYINEREFEISTTTPRDWEPKGYIYDAFEDDDWEETIKSEFGMRLIETEYKEEIEL